MKNKDMLCQYSPTSGSTLPYEPCRTPELVFGSGCLQTSFDLAAAEFKIPVVKAPVRLLICIKHVREHGIHKELGLPSGFSATGIVLETWKHWKRAGGATRCYKPTGIRLFSTFTGRRSNTLSQGQAEGASFPGEGAQH